MAPASIDAAAGHSTTASATPVPVRGRRENPDSHRTMGCLLVISEAHHSECTSEADFEHTSWLSCNEDTAGATRPCRPPISFGTSYTPPRTRVSPPLGAARLACPSAAAKSTPSSRRRRCPSSRTGAVSATHSHEAAASATQRRMPLLPRADGGKHRSLHPCLHQGCQACCFLEPVLSALPTRKDRSSTQTWPDASR